MLLPLVSMRQIVQAASPKEVEKDRDASNAINDVESRLRPGSPLCAWHFSKMAFL